MNQEDTESVEASAAAEMNDCLPLEQQKPNLISTIEKLSSQNKSKKKGRRRRIRSGFISTTEINMNLVMLIIAFLNLCLVQVQANLPPYFTADLNNHILIENTPVGTPIYTLRAVDPEKSELKFGIMGTDKLSVDEKTGVVRVMKPIDREDGNTLKVTVTVEDVVANLKEGDENNLVKLPVSVIIQDLNDNAPIFQNKNTYEALEIMEDTEIGSKILDVNLIDPDITGLHLNINCTSTSQSPEACNIFPIEVHEVTAGYMKAELKLGKKLDYNKRSLYQFILTATDGDHISRAAVVIRIKDVQNTPPVFIGSMSGRVLEDAPIGTLVMVLQARDGDSGNPRGVKLTLLTNPGEVFELDSDTGRLTTARPLDREALGTVLIMQVKAQEIRRPDEPPISSVAEIDILQTIANITVLIDDIQDEKPLFNSIEYFVEIEENTPVGTPLPDLDMIVHDKDSGTFADFTLRIDGPLAEYFDVEPKFASGTVRPTIRVKKAFDYENPNERKFLVSVVAQNVEEPELYSSATIYLVIQDKNDNKPKFDKEFYTLTVSENAEPGTKVGSIVAFDPDSNEFGNEGLVYQLVGSGSKKFSVNPRTGEISVAECSSSSGSNSTVVTSTNCLDYETQKSYDLLYMASDSYKQEGFVHSIVPLKIMVADANDNTPFYKNKFHRIILENTKQFEPRFFIKAQDIDDRTMLLYKMLDSTPPELAEEHFGIDEVSAELVIKTPQTLPPNNYTFLIEASDDIFKTTTLVIVNVTDINNNAPIFNSTMPRSIRLLENTDIGTILLQLQATDADFNKNGEIFYMINSGSYGYFDIEEDSGEIRLVKELNSSVLSKFELSVSAVDKGIPQLRSETIIHIQVYKVYIDLPQIEPVIQRVQVSESTKIGDVVTQISTNFFNDSITMEDLELRFEFVEPIEGRNSDNKIVEDKDLVKQWFTITNEGKVIALQHLVREIMSSANITIMLTSEKARPGSKSYGTLLLTVFEVNDYPPRIEDIEIETYEELPPGMPILSMLADDPEGRQISNYFIGEGAEYVSIDNKTGDIRVAGRLDYEDSPTINFTVVAVDSGVPQLSSTGTIMLALLNINDNAPEFNQTIYEGEVVEHSPEDTYVLTVFASDIDGDAISYELEPGEYSSAFRIDRFGKVTVSKDGRTILDREEMKSPIITIGVRAKDPEYSGFATLRLRVKDINDVWPKFETRNYHTRVYAPLRAGEEILKVKAHGGDEEETDEIRYKIYAGNELELFTIDKKTGIISAIRAHELSGEVHLVIEVTDRKGNTSSSDHFDRTGVYIQIFPGNFRKPEFKFPNRVNSTLPAVESDSKEIELFSLGNYSIVLGSVMAYDTDEGEAGRIQYYFKEGENLVTETQNSFRIETDSGKIIQISPLDREEIDRYNLVVVAKDGGRPVSAETMEMLTIEVTDIDDHQAIFAQKYYNFTIKENALENTFIGQVKAIDNDYAWNAHVFYFLVATDANRHYIFNDIKVEIKTGVILSNAILDHERINSYVFYIRASSSPLANKSAETLMMEDFESEPSIAKINVTVLDENDNASQFKKREYFVGVNWDAEPGREILTFESTDVDPTSQSNIQYSLLSSNLLLEDLQEGGSVVPSPFRVDPNTGRLTVSPSAMRQYGGGTHKFKVKVGLKETIPPFHQDTTQVKVWVVESNQEAILTVKTPPNEVPRDMLIELLGNITGRLVLINKVTPHVGEGVKVNKEWSDVYVTPIDKKSSQIVPIPQFLQSLDLAHDRIRKSGLPIELYSAVPAVSTHEHDGERRESFDTAFAGLVALVALLCMGLATILAICCCLNRMYANATKPDIDEKTYSGLKYPLHSAVSMPGTPIMTRSIIGHQPEMMEELATDNPLWIDHNTKSYEEQELTMQVASDLDNSNGLEEGLNQEDLIVTTEAQSLQRNNQNSPQFSHAYATLHPHPPDYDLLGDEDDTIAVHL